MTRDLESDLQACLQLLEGLGEVPAGPLTIIDAFAHALERALAAEDRVEKLERELRLIHDHYQGGDGPNGNSTL